MSLNFPKTISQLIYVQLIAFKLSTAGISKGALYYFNNECYGSHIFTVVLITKYSISYGTLCGMRYICESKYPII